MNASQSALVRHLSDYQSCHLSRKDWFVLTWESYSWEWLEKETLSSHFISHSSQCSDDVATSPLWVWYYHPLYFVFCCCLFVYMTASIQKTNFNHNWDLYRCDVLFFVPPSSVFHHRNHVPPASFHTLHHFEVFEGWFCFSFLKSFHCSVAGQRFDLLFLYWSPPSREAFPNYFWSKVQCSTRETRSQTISNFNKRDRGPAFQNLTALRSSRPRRK